MRGSNFSGVKIHTNESILAHRHQYYSVLCLFIIFWSFFSSVFIHHSPTAEMETRPQSSSSSSGIIVFIYMKLLKHYMPHVPDRKVWFSAQFMGSLALHTLLYYFAPLRGSTITAFPAPAKNWANPGLMTSIQNPIEPLHLTLLPTAS